MAQENSAKPTAGHNTPRSTWILFTLRLFAFFATASATIVMALNKETKSLVVATIGTNQIKVALTAKFQHTPAFVFFVVANGMASLHTLFMMVVEVYGKKFANQGRLLSIVAILDMMIVALVSAGVHAAAFMAEVGKNGNKHARWDKICDKFEGYCNQGGGALIASFVGLCLLVVTSSMSILKLSKLKTDNNISIIIP